MQQEHLGFLPNLHLLQSSVMDLIKEGVMVISHTLRPIYLNLKARELCQRLWNENLYSDSLPPVISELYHQSIRKLNSPDKLLLKDCQIAGGQTIRIRVYRLSLEFERELNATSMNRSSLLVFLEDRCVSLQEELRIEQRKYNLTEREMQILGLLLQAYTYHEIAKMLQISLNTVKFHAKNIYAKKRNYLEEDQKTYFELENNRTTQKGSVHPIRCKLKPNQGNDFNECVSIAI